jgi:ribosome maturation factor RimP
MADRKQLIRLLEPEVEAMGYELVDLLYREGHKHALLRVYIDLLPGAVESESDAEAAPVEGVEDGAPRGVGLDDCERVSHQVSGLLDVDDPIPCGYELEVSSPGANRPLRTVAHFERFAGRRIRVELVAEVDGRRRYTGAIEKIVDGVITLNVDEERFDVNMNDIDRARLVPER